MVQMVSLSYGGCCVRGLCVIEVQEGQRGKELVQTGEDYQRGTTKTRSTPNRETARQRKYVHLQSACLRTCGDWGRGADVKIEADVTVGIFCEAARKETIAIATAVTLPCCQNSVIPDASHWFDKIFTLKRYVEFSAYTGNGWQDLCFWTLSGRDCYQVINHLVL